MDGLSFHHIVFVVIKRKIIIDGRICLFIVYAHIRVYETALTINPEDNSTFSEENNPLYIVLISKI